MPDAETGPITSAAAVAAVIADAAPAATGDEVKAALASAGKRGGRGNKKASVDSTDPLPKPAGQSKERLAARIKRDAPGDP